MNKQRLIRILTIVVLILMVPLVAMLFTNEVNWSPFDFIIAGILLLTAGLLLDFVYRKVHKTLYKIVFLITIIFMFLIWAELAVGIFGSPFAGN